MEFHQLLRRKRIEAGVKATDVAREMLLTKSQYSAIETGRKKIDPDLQGEFLEDVEDIIERYSQWWVDRDGLTWKKVTPRILERALAELARGKSIIQVSVKFNVSDVDLRNQVKDTPYYDQK